LFKNITDHKKYVLFSYLAIGSNMLTGFILFPLILNKLGLAALGVFGLLFSFKSIIEIGIGWLSGSITKNLIKYKFLKGNISSLSFLLNFIYGVFAFCIILIYGYIAKEEYMESIYYFAGFSLISFAIVPFYEIMISELKQYQVAIFKFLQQFLFMILSISSFLFFDISSLSIIFLVLLISVLIVLFAVSIYFFKNFVIKFSLKKINKVVLHKIFFTDGIKYFFNGMSTILLLQIDVLLIDYMYGSESAGIYLIIWKIPNTIIMLGWRLSDPFAAIVANGLKVNNHSEIKKQFYIFEKKLFLSAFFVSSIYFLLANYVLDIWIGKENIPNIEYMYIVTSIVILFSVMQRLYLSVNYYTDGLNTISFLQFIEIGFKILFIIFFFDYFQELAPVVGWLVAFLFTLIIYRINSLRILNNV